MNDPSAILSYRLKDYTVPANQTLCEALRLLDLLPEQVLAVRGGTMITADQILLPGERVELISVISGG